MTMKWMPSSVPVSYTETRLGWFRRAAACASRRNRVTKFASPAYWGDSTFTATGRPRTVSVPLNTVAMPPRPSSDSTWYRPPRSIWAVTWSFVRSLMQCRLHDGLGDGGGHHAARRVAAKATAVEDDDGDRDLGVLGGSERHEPRMGRQSLAVLGGAGLPRHLDPGDLRDRTRPALHHAHHHLRELDGRLRRDGLAEDLGGEGLDDLAARIPDLRHEARPHLRSAVGDGRGHQGHLHGIGRHVVLSDGRQRDGRKPVREVGCVREHPTLERDVEGDGSARGVRGEPEGVRLGGELGRSEPKADLAEHHVARDREGLSQCEL